MKEVFDPNINFKSENKKETVTIVIDRLIENKSVSQTTTEENKSTIRGK